MSIVLTLVVLVAVVAVVAFFALRKKAPQDSDATAASRERAPATTLPSGPAPTAARTPAAARASSERAPEPNVAPAADDSSLEVEEISSPEAGREASVTSPPPPPVRTPKPGRVRGQVDLQSLRKGLAKSRDSEGFFGRLRNLLSGRKEIPSEIAGELEELLLTSDVGVTTTEAIIGRIQEQLSRGELEREDQVWGALRQEALRILAAAGEPGPIRPRGEPTVVLFVGVNGAGKTTTIGKLAKKLTGEGKKVMLAAGDTFRAAAVDQLKAWGERTGCEVISGKDNADPSSVLFDAITAARAAGVDVLLADTAGRLHTKTNLMQEMTKIARTAAKALDGAPHEVLLVVDSTNGQNAMAQAKEFKEALPLTGLVLTKLDGTARGGVVLGICGALQVPVRYVGLGEKAEDLHEFSAIDFVEALLGRDTDEIAA